MNTREELRLIHFKCSKNVEITVMGQESKFEESKDSQQPSTQQSSRSYHIEQNQKVISNKKSFNLNLKLWNKRYCLKMSKNV